MIGKKLLVFSLVLFLLIGCSSSVLAASVSEIPNSELGVTVSENKGDPVAVIGKDEFLISKGTVLTGDMLIEGLGLKVVDADGNDLHMPEKIRFGFGESHTADEEAAIVNDFFIGQNYANSGISVYAKVDGVPYYDFRATVTTMDNSNVTYPVEDPYRGVVSAIIGQHNIAIPYGSKITGDMILDNLKVVDAEGNDLGLSDQITFSKPVVFELKEITADGLADLINTYFEGNQSSLSSEGLAYNVDLRGPDTYFSFNFYVSRYYDKDDFVVGEPYAITGDSEELEVYVDEGKTPVLTGNMLTKGLKVVDINGNDLGMTDKIIFFKGKTPDAEAERLKNFFLSEGWLRHQITAVIDGYSESIQFNIIVRSVTTKDDGTVDKVGKSIAYTTHVQNYGWQKSVADSKMSGTSGESLRLEGIKIETGIEGLGVSYATHVENIGWQDPVVDGAISGTSGKGLRLEAIRIKLTGEQAENYDVYYRVHAQNVGWMGWASNGTDAGTAGYGYRLEGIEIQIVAKGANAPGSTNNAFIQK
ncbi:hypothetical protein ACIZ62_12070 [Acetobacterium carbinolicum]|uniref:hypothetical protein n=1 Tax=Acetobacterium carbinolicum TaxID=52690 RepID=UPI0039BF920B